ncbi:MAG: hypothetical protein ABIC57_02770, partial [bacterium]
ESKCKECGKCACCPVGAIYFTANKEEYELIKKQVEKDPRKISDLFVNRYGAQMLPDHYVVDESEIESKVLKYPGKVAIEAISEDTIECLLKCIPVKELFRDSEYTTYRKVLIKNTESLKKFSISKYPCLLFFENGKLKGKIEGFYGVGQKEELLSEINKIE